MPIDNLAAIDILKSVTELLRAIEYDDIYYIEKDIRDIKENLAEFEKVFYRNRAVDLYKKH